MLQLTYYINNWLSDKNGEKYKKYEIDVRNMIGKICIPNMQ